MTFDKNKIPHLLIQNFKDNLGACFVGAGLSVGAGLPSWDGLLKELIAEAKKLSWISKDKISEWEHLVNDASKFLFLAEDIKTDLASRYEEYMDERFSQKKYTPTKAHELLVKLKTNLILTINYDDLIEVAYNKMYGNYPNSFIYNQSKEAANNFWKGKFFVLKAHGDAKRDVNTLILSQKDYRRTLYREPGYRSLLQAIFTTKSILFLGVSLTDPEFNQLLDYLHDSYHGGGPPHFVLLDEINNKQTLAKQYLEQFKVQTITFSNPKKDYKEVEEFLELLHGMI